MYKLNEDKVVKLFG